MANGFEIAQSGDALWNSARHCWVYDFVVRHSQGELKFKAGIDENTPEGRRDTEAKRIFREFLEKLSGEVAHWTSQ